MKIFVSYTTRNNEVRLNSLIDFSNKIKSLGKTFIDLIDNNSHDKQDRVVKELKNANLLILIKSKSTFDSEWVRFEIGVANQMNLPIIEFDINEIKNLTRRQIKSKINIADHLNTPNKGLAKLVGKLTSTCPIA